MKGLITMDDLTNEDIHSILADAQRLLPVARGETYLPLLEGKYSAICFSNQALELECPLRLR